MTTINIILLICIVIVFFWAGFLTCALLCINDLKPGLTQLPEEAAKDESHSATRYKSSDESPITREARKAAEELPWKVS
jgi:hypothetical protein